MQVATIAQCKHCDRIIKPNTTAIQLPSFPWQHANGYLACWNPDEPELIHLAGCFAELKPKPQIEQRGVLTLIQGGVR